MKRRDFLQLTGAALISQIPATAWSQQTLSETAAFAKARHYADLPFGKIAYVEQGRGDAALFLHGAPLNGFQWRGAIDRLASHRRCIAPDFMGLGYSQAHEQQSLAAAAQSEMLAALLDSLGITAVDIIASDSGGAVAQLFALRYPQRMRTLLLTNCDTEPNSPPPAIQPVLDMARAGTLADATAKWLTNTALARSTFGAAVYHDPSRLSGETIAYYVTPLVSSPLRKKQYHDFHNALKPNPLAGIEAQLKRSTVPVRMVWGASDTIFPLADAQYLERTFPKSRGIRQVPEGKLFFQEEYPDIIAEEALRLWQPA